MKNEEFLQHQLEYLKELTHEMTSSKTQEFVMEWIKIHAEQYRHQLSESG